MEEIALDPDPHLLSVLLDGFYKGFPPEAVLTTIILLLMLVASGLISGSETAFFSFQPADIEKLKKKYGKRGRKVLALRDKPKELLATILISNNFINVGIVVISTYLTTLLFNLKEHPVLTFLVQIVLVTSFLLIFGEILPKIYANKKPVSFALMMVDIIAILLWFFKPLSMILVRSTGVIDKKLAAKKSAVSMSDLSAAIDITVNESTPEEEKKILKGIATFGETEASEVMRSRVDVTAVEKGLPFSEVLQIVTDSGYSRIPVYRENLDHVEGLLYIKDLLPYIDTQKEVEWTSLIRPAFFVPENKKINDLLQEFREKKIHMAIVVDEYGGTSGIITLEDILEEIVGEISDEFDVEEEAFQYKKINANTYLFDAKTPLNDLCRILSVDDETFDRARGESDSLGGLILELEGKIPAKGEKIIYDRFTFEIVDADERKINKVKIILKPENQNA
ncbi:gliding motility-associated protein GldE [Candidatus Sulfidibacterium hydrothermale]|uniref:gliding motility-associated protein GldE n=1 Tax=Candidatus Sulfidibacterium hydrothermale TaxID=2875962 RepID=UPI001F0ACF12|nr:gliding motility-associated protein GldE [Candidatus Sulfidibacterium hydrothermale]UBM62835.1 gliding motility-associated protein GldE [Candidatus Sulfidibacterium hydrothermale]